MRTSSSIGRKQRHPALTASAMLVVLTMFAAACGSTAQVGLEGSTTVPGDTSAGVVATEDGLAVADDGLSAGGDVGGSTAADTGGAATGSAAGGSAGTTAGGTAGGGATAPSGASNPGASSSGGGGSGGSGGGSTGGSAPSGGTGRMGPGVTAKEIVVGIAIPDEASKSGNQNLLGASGISVGNTERYFKIMQEDINKRGGILGRKVRYSTFRYSTADGAQTSQLEQSACAHWTQDDRAFQAQFTSSDNFLSCAEKNQLATTAEALSASDDRTFATYPHHFQISAMSLTRQMAIMPGGLDRQRYFDSGYKLGIVTYDHPAFARAVDGTLVPALKKLGKHVDTEIQRVTYLNSNDELGRLTAEIQSAVLRFKTDGITHVLIIERNALLMLLFARSAENQDYRPRYGLNSQNGFTAIAPNIPQGQFNRAVGVGWLPTLDVPARELPPSKVRDRCLARFARYGEKPADPNNASVMVGVCERMDFLKAAVEAGGPDITVDSFARGAEALGRSFPSYGGMGNVHFGPGRHAGAAFYRTASYDPKCNCFHYTSKNLRVP